MSDHDKDLLAVLAAILHTGHVIAGASGAKEPPIGQSVEQARVLMLGCRLEGIARSTGPLPASTDDDDFPF